MLRVNWLRKILFSLSNETHHEAGYLIGVGGVRVDRPGEVLPRIKPKRKGRWNQRRGALVIRRGTYRLAQCGCTACRFFRFRPPSLSRKYGEAHVPGLEACMTGSRITTSSLRSPASDFIARVPYQVAQGKRSREVADAVLEEEDGEAEAEAGGANLRRLLLCSFRIATLPRHPTPLHPWT